MIELNNIKIPDPKHEIDLCLLQDGPHISDPGGAKPSALLPQTHLAATDTAAAYMTRTKSVPSLSTIHSVKKSITEAGNR